MDNDFFSRPSRSQRKRDMLNLQKIGEKLVGLSATQLAQIPLDEALRNAIDEARSLKGHEAKRRQLQFIGKLIRNIDIEPIKEALDKVQDRNLQAKAQFHQIEKWRDKLVKLGDPALEEFLKLSPNIDIQHIRQLIRRARSDLKSNKNSGADTELFRYIREIIISLVPSTPNR